MQQIMVVDNSATVRKMLKFALSGNGYQIMEACDGNEALQVLGCMEKDMVSLMITDLDMSGLDGVQLVQLVRRHPEHRLMPIIMLSKLGDSRIREGQRAGISTLVLKPFHAQQIVNTVALILGSEGLGNH